MESATGEDGILKAGSGWTEIFIYPGYQLQNDGLTDHQFPSAGVHTGDAGIGTGGKRAYYGSL